MTTASDRVPPSAERLQEFVTQYGSYAAIDWVEWDRLNAANQEHRLAVLHKKMMHARR